VRAAVEPFLPQSSVYVIHQDRRGFLWFGTREGLGRWDGAEMRSWKSMPFTPNALEGSIVRRLVEDRTGNLWFTTQAADRRPMRIAQLVGPEHETVRTYAFAHAVPFLDRDGDAWVADRDSLWRFDGSRFSAVTPRFHRSDPVAAFMDSDGTIFVTGEGSGGIERYASDSTRVVIEDPEPNWNDPDVLHIAGFFEDERGTLWVPGRGLRRLDSTRTRLMKADNVPSALDTVGTTQIVQDPDGWLWLGTLDGVYRFDPALTHFERYPLRLPGNVATQNWVRAIARDRSGAIWAGTAWGLHRYDPADDVFGVLAHDPTNPNTIGSGIVLSLFEDATGSLWVGTLAGGLNRIDRRTSNVQRFRHRPGDPNSLANDFVWSLADAGNGRIWAGLGSGLALIDPNGTPAVRHIDLGPPTPGWPASVTSLRVDRDGGLWIGGGARLLYRAASGNLRRYDLPVAAEIHAILLDGAALWLGTTAGLVHLDPQTGTTRVFRHNPTDPKSLADDVVISLFRDRAGTIWAGTNRGLNRLESDSVFTLFDARAGFPSSVIYTIQQDDDGRLWLATNRGLVRFDPSVAGGGVRVYDAASGVGNVEFNRNAGLRGRDGTLYFGGDRGVTYFHPSTLRDNTYRPPVLITAMHLSTREGTRTSGYVGNDTVLVAPDDYTVTFELAALSFTQPQRNRYAYRLEGFDAQWAQAGTNRVVSYTNLPPGRYVFRARASNEDGTWNVDGVSVPVIVQPWLWETLWFRVLASLAVIAAAATIAAYAQRNRSRRQLETLRHQRALDDERARISRDMHDEVGASLTEIAILSELAVRRDDERTQRSELDKIAGRSRRMLDAIGEIIWALDPGHDQSDHLASYLREFAAGYLESAGLRAELSFATTDSASTLTSEFRRNVFLILKEALANVAKHAHANTVRVELVQHDDHLELTISDDGVGIDDQVGGTIGSAFGERTADSIDTAADARHHGLTNMRQRASAVGASLSVEALPGGGTRVHLDAPLPAGAVK
jgi:signal transduction histidine kinase/ligand-binding sensor domain-containing protein